MSTEQPHSVEPTDSSGSEDNSKKITFQPFLDKDYDCPLCQTHFKHRWQLRNHLHTEKKHYPEDHPYQEEIDDYLEQLEINPDLIPIGNTCDHCQKELRNKYSRKRHQEHCRLNPINPNYRPLTPEWVKEYNHNLELKQHTKNTITQESTSSSTTGSSATSNVTGSSATSSNTANFYTSSSGSSFYSAPTAFTNSTTPVSSSSTSTVPTKVVRSTKPIRSAIPDNYEDICKILANNGRITIFKHPLFNITTGGPREVTIEPLYPIYISPVDGKLKILFDLDSVSN